VLVFVEGGKLDNLEKEKNPHSMARTNNKLPCSHPSINSPFPYLKTGDNKHDTEVYVED